MKVELKLITQDPSVDVADEQQGGIEGFHTEKPEHFLDGPVCRRVAVIDFDNNGALAPGVPFALPAKDRVLARYTIRNPKDLRSRDFNQVSVFSTVLKTIYMFEEEDTLGRDLRWAFDAPQLLVVPRAGQKANAYYERDSHSLQFFYFPSVLTEGTMVFTSLSHDIVAHETGHAILDGIAPDLYNALSPQSLALHEGIADLVALIMAFRSNYLPRIVLGKTQGSIREPSAFSWLAEEFGRARDPKGRRGYLRSIMNQKTLDPFDETLDENGEPNQVSRKKPHDLSQVLTGALYSVMVSIHEQLKKSYAEKDGKTEFSVSGKALAVAANRFKQLVLRALDYLPPGEVSFADYGRAILASDQASYPTSTTERKWITDEFVRRMMVEDESELAVKSNFDHPTVAQLDLQALVESDWVAYEFANQNREFLGIPLDVSFRVRPRLDVTKNYYQKDGEKRVRECIFKVSWDARESSRLRNKGFPANRQITAGTMLAIDWETKAVRALLMSDVARDGAPNLKLQEDRTGMLGMLADEGILQADGEHRAGEPWIESAGDLMRIRRSFNLLHLADDAGEPAAIGSVSPDQLKPPPGVDTGAFFNLVEKMRNQAASGSGGIGQA